MKLPLVVSLPHAGLGVPSEVRALCALEPAQVAEDGDVGAAEIYDLRSEVRRFVTTEVARAIVDMNRSADDFHKDGVIKTHTCWDVPVWRRPLPAELGAELIRRYHAPYHARLSEADAEVVLGVDCHTMAACGPPVGPDPGRERPAVCLSNAHRTMPEREFRRLVGCFERVFEGEVAVDRPFRGGYIVRTHCTERPWVQIELSRAPFDTTSGKRARVLAALTDWCAGPG